MATESELDGVVVETLNDPALIRLRDQLASVITGRAAAQTLFPYLDGVSRRPRLTDDGLDWVLDAPASSTREAELVIEWARVERDLPGRLRACANEECSKFLIDHSKPNTARWCSMADCGNRLKARRHYARQKDASREPV
jgi:predicted RNA-binding Zn ribbon-like protein